MPIKVQYLNNNNTRRLQQVDSFTSVNRCTDKVVTMDRFSQSFQMKLDKGILTLPTASGFCATIFLGLIMVTYASIKTNSLITKRNNDVFTTTSDHFFDHNFIFDYESGLDLAIGFTAYDSV